MGCACGNRRSDGVSDGPYVAENVAVEQYLVVICGPRPVDTMFVVMARFCRAVIGVESIGKVHLKITILFDLEKGVQRNDEST